jgi:hypothetical protein
MLRLFVLIAFGHSLAEGAFLGSESLEGKSHLVQIGRGGIAKLILARREKPLSEQINNPTISDQTPGNVAKHFGPTRQDATPREKYAFIYGCHDNLEVVFGKNAEFWYTDWKLWLGAAIWLAVWIKWLKYGWAELYWVQALFTFGINIVILHHLQYAETVKWGMLVVCTLLCIQACFQSFMWSKAELASDISAIKEETLQVETMYLDLALPMEQVCVVFIAQLCVSWFYLTYILANFDIDRVNYTFWVVAYLTMQMTMIFCRGADSALGKAFPSHDVYQLLVDSDRITVELATAGKPFRISRASLFLRGATGFFCNAVLREILAYTIPLMLMSFADPMDFVVYCVGVNFICTVDDTKDRTYIVKYHEEDKKVDV